MNKSYKLIFNKKRGEFVVASELAQGAKKSSARKILPLVSGLLMSAATLAVPAYAIGDISLRDSYNPGIYVCGDDVCDLGSIDGKGAFFPPLSKEEVTDIDTDNTKTGSKQIIVKDGKTGTIKFETTPEFHAEYRDPNKSTGLEKLIAEGAAEINITNEDGVTTINNKTPDWESKFAELKWDEYSTTPKDTITIPYTNSDGTVSHIEVYSNLAGLKGEGTPSFSASIIAEQPLQPFYEFEIARAEKGGILNLAPEKDVEWNLVNTKESSLFLATDEGQIFVTNGSDNPDDIKKIHVDFGNATIINETPSVTKDIGPNNKFVAAEFTHPELEGVIKRDSFQIDSLADLAELNELLIESFANGDGGGITPEQYKNIMDSAINSVIKADDTPIGNITYEPPIKLDDEGNPINSDSYFLSEGIKAPVGMLAVLKVSGKGSEITIEKGVRLSATTQSGGIARNLYVTDEGKATHKSTTYITDGSNRNAEVDSGGTYINDGSLIFGYQLDEVTGKPISKDGAEILGDLVSGEGSTYKNIGGIFIAQNDKKDAQKGNLAISVTNGAKAENSGDIYIGSIEASGKGTGNTASGVMIQTSGTFENYENIYLGYEKTDKGPAAIAGLIGGGSVSTFNIDETHNAMGAKVGADSEVTLINSGTIDISEGVRNAVGIHVNGVELAKGEDYENVKVTNNGSILIDGNHNIGMRVTRASWTGDTDIFLKAKHAAGRKITVKGSDNTGIVAGNGTEVRVDGSIDVFGKILAEDAERPKNFNYGIQAENSKVNFGDDSKLTLEGDYLVGVRADKGAIVDLEGVEILSETGENQTHYWISGWNSGTKNSSSIKFGALSEALILNTAKSTLFRIDKGAKLTTQDDLKSEIVVNGDKSIGFYIADEGTEFSGNGLNLTIKGDNGVGIKVVSGAGTGIGDKNAGEGKVTIGSADGQSNSKPNNISILGAGGIFAQVDGKKHNILGDYDIEKPTTPGAELTSYEKLNGTNIAIDKGAIGYELLNGGKLVHEGEINFNPKDSASIDPDKAIVGVRIDGGVLINEKDAVIDVNGVGVDIVGRDSKITNHGKIQAKNGIAGIRVNEKASVTLGGRGGDGLVEGDNKADAVLALAGSIITADMAQIKILGEGAGLHFQNADDKDGVFKLSGSGKILVKGLGYGIYVEGKGGVTSDSEFVSSHSKDLYIDVVEAAGNGIKINTRGNIHSGASVNMYSDEAKSALVVTGGSEKIIQSGILKSASQNTDSSLVDLTKQNRVYSDIGPNGDAVYDQANSPYKHYEFTNLGMILAQSINPEKNQVAIRAESFDSDVTIVNGSMKNSLDDFVDEYDKEEKRNKIKITGDIKLEGSSNYNVQLYGNSASENIITDSGNDTFTLTNVQGEKDSNILFKHIDGGKRIDDGERIDINKLVLNTEGTVSTNVEDYAASYYVLQKDQIKLENIDLLDIQYGSRFELRNAELIDSIGDRKIDINIEENGQLFINKNSLNEDSYTFENKLLGDGLVTTDLKGSEKEFYFDQSNGAGDFKGTFAIGNGTFEIAKENSKALANATLRLDSSGIGFMKKDSLGERIEGLKFNNGTLVVEEKITTGKIDNAIDSILTVGKLDLGKGGSVSLSLGKEVNEVFSASTPGILYSEDLLLQDEGKITIQLVHSEQAVENGGAVIVVDIDGEEIELGEEAEKEIGIYQDGIEEAVATGKYGLVTQTNDGTVNNEGLYLSYALESVTLNGQVDASKGADWYKGALNLQVASDGSDNAQEFKATISGDGDLVINTDPNKAELKLSGSNDYKGATYVISGGLELLADTALGKTRLLDIASGSSVRLSKDVESKVGQLNTSENSGLHLGAGGQLTITGQKYDESDIASDIGLDSLIAGSLTGGAGAKLVLEKYKLQVVGANTAYKGDVDVHVDTTLELNHTQGVGNEGQIDLAGKLHLNGVGQGAYQKQIIGTDSNEVLVDNNSTVVFVADHTGISNINIGGATGSDVSRVIVQKEQHLAGTDGLAISDVNIRKNSTLELNTNEAHWVVNNKVDGAGNLHKSGAGMIELIKDSAQYTGKTTVESGILIAGNNENALDLQSTEMFIAKAGTFTGLGSINGSVINEGNFFVGQLFDLPEGKSPDEYVKDRPEYVEDKNADITDTLALTKNEAAGNDVDGALKNDATGNDVDDAFKNKANYIVKKDFTNKGNVFLSNSFTDSDLSTGTNLLVRGNYISSGGAIFMNTVLNAGHEEATTDKLIVEGDVKTDGEATKLYISNAQGLGAYTDQQPDAIKVVHVDGQSDHNAFTLGNQVAIGVYEYTLHQGRNPENSQSWFLDSYDKNLNPGIGAFIGNQNAAIGMFSMTLHDRMGNLGYSDPSLITEDDDTLNSAWVRIVAERNKYKAIDQKMSIKSNTYIVHLGTDFYKWTDDLGATRRLGVMAGYGHGDIKSRSNTGFNAQGKIDSAYNVGLYGTYYNPNGFYVDAWAQHSWFKNEISIGGASKNYRSKLLSLSLEVGHTFDISEVSSEGKQWRFQPQGQVTWHKYKLRNNVVSDSGLAVTNLPSHTTVARLGAKFIYANAQDVDSKMQPFVELNWIHSNANKAIEFNDWYTTSNNAPKNRYELKVGIEGKYNNRWSVWGNVATQMGKDSYRNYRGTVGAKYDF